MTNHPLKDYVIRFYILSFNRIFKMVEASHFKFSVEIDAEEF